MFNDDKPKPEPKRTDRVKLNMMIKLDAKGKLQAMADSYQTSLTKMLEFIIRGAFHMDEDEYRRREKALAANNFSNRP